jgi:hypothetical protein
VSHQYVCENCGKTKTCAIAGCQGTCTKLCVKCCAQSLRERGLKVSPELAEDCPECGGAGDLHNHGCSQYTEEKRSQNQHTKESDCEVDPETGLCRGCGVDHSEECPECHGHGYHQDGCTEIE